MPSRKSVDQESLGEGQEFLRAVQKVILIKQTLFPFSAQTLKLGNIVDCTVMKKSRIFTEAAL